MLPVCAVVFFVSGFAALLYQVIWQRILAIFSGADVYSATIIVAAFMAGLGIGSLGGGYLADRVSRRTSLMLFGVAELAIAAFGSVSAAIYYDFLYLRLGHVDLAPPVLATMLFVILLWPTFLMGASLPLLAKALTPRVERAALTVGLLYGLNTLGAAAGALIGTWVLLPWVGLEQSLGVAAGLNATAALVVLPFAMSRRVAAQTAQPIESASTATAPRATPAAIDGSLGFSTWVLIYAFAGFLALSLEIVWFRTLGVMMKATSFTFGTLLALYLTGLAVGSIAASFVAPRIRRPATVFLTLQAATVLYATGLIALIVSAIDDVPRLQGYFGSYEPLSAPESVQRLEAIAASLVHVEMPTATVPGSFLLFYLALPFALVVPATTLMGFSLPVLQRVVHTDVSTIGRRLGILLCANIVGCVVGTVVTGWQLLNDIGTPGTFKLLSAMSVVFVALAVVLIRRSADGPRPRRYLRATVAVLLIGVPLTPLVAMPNGVEFWAQLHGTSSGNIVFSEDGSGVSLIKLDQPDSGGKQVVFVNGLGQSALPYGEIHTVLGAIPAFLHPHPTSAMVIGLGSGDTVHAVAGRPEIDRITSIEIVRSQLPTLEALSRRVPYGGLQALLTNPRIEHVIGDGRIHLMRNTDGYDIIEADALRPGSAYAGNLYSAEFFRLVRARLRPGGLAATWVPTERVRSTFLRAFPYVVSLPHVMVGSNTAIELDRGSIAARLAESAVERYYRSAGIDIARLFEEFLAAPVTYTPDFDRSGLTDFNTDLFPKDEYDLSSPPRGDGAIR